MSEIRTEAFDEGMAEDVIAFWVAEGAYPEDTARQRVEQVLLVALAGDATVVGALTARLVRNERLHMPMWYLAAYVAAGHRRSSVMRHLVYAARDRLRDRFVEGDDRAQGIVVEVHNRELAHLPPAEWEAVDLAFIGETASGAPVRVHYFPGAVAPPGPVLQGSA